MPSPLCLNLPRRAAARLGEFPCTPWLSSINSHALLRREGIQQPSNTRENAEEEEEEEEKWSRGTVEL